MKKVFSLVLALLICAACCSVGVAADDAKVQDVIARIDSFLDLHEVFNDCESHLINDAEFIANVNSGALSFEMVSDPVTEGSRAGLFTKKRDDDCDIPIIVRSASEWFLSAYDYIEFDLFLTDGFKHVERTQDSWARIIFQSEWTNNPDEHIVSSNDAIDLVFSLKAGWNHIRYPLPKENGATFKQFLLRIGYNCFEAEAYEGIVIDNFLLTASGIREMDMSDEADLLALKADYDALTDEEKAMVTNKETLDRLLAQMDEVKAEYQQQIQDVIDMIDALPAPEDVTEDDEMDIVDAEIALSDLGYSQSKEVTNQDKLTAVREAFNRLKNGVRGDVDGDGVASAADALAILKSVVGKQELTDQEKAAADLTGDGTIGADDALIVLRIVVGKE